MTTLVALPYRDAAPFVARAVRSVLAQSERDIVLLVLGDGERPPVKAKDDRLIVGFLPRWHGPPFVQQAMLLGSPFDWYAPFGADDWADPDHLALMASMGAPAVCAGAVWWHDDPKTPPVRIRKANYEVGRYRTEVLRSIGGYGAQERLGQDNLMLHILGRTHGMQATDRPTYHRLRRPGSLTSSPETGLDSPIRKAIRGRNHQLAWHLRRIGWRHHEAIRAYRESLVPATLRAELADAAGHVARLLA